MKNFVRTIFLNRFRVDTLLSSGASGSLYRGWDLKRNLPLSIKIYDTPVPNDPNALCFQQDEGTLQTLMHPNIAPFYGLFEDQGVSFLVEKFIDGQVLAQILQQRNGQPLPAQEALVYLKTLATALEYAHGFGLVHCNVNPFNILVGQDGNILLTNFGFARHADRTMSPSGLVGLPAYNAPEQLRGATVSPATDVYALGMLLFELTTGVHPFLRICTSLAAADAATIDRLRTAHLTQPPPDPLQLNPNLPEGIRESITIALAKDPKQRYQSAQEMLEIICATFGIPVQQVPERLRGAATGTGSAQPPTQVLQSGTMRVEGAGAGQQYVQPTQGIAPAYYQQPANAYPPADQGATGTQVLPGQAWQGTMPVQATPPQAFPAAPASEYLAEKPKRPTWFWWLIGAVAVLVVLCGIGLGAGLPILKDLLGTETLTPTPTITATAIPPTEPALPPAALPSATMVEIIPPTLAPPPPPPPTQIPIPTIVPLPTQPPVPPTISGQYGFKVTIHNNKGYPIFPFRDGTVMGNPIPPYKYVWYLNIPAGPHVFTFCVDQTMSNCPVTKQVMVDRDLDVNVP